MCDLATRAAVKVQKRPRELARRQPHEKRLRDLCKASAACLSRRRRGFLAGQAVDRPPQILPRLEADFHTSLPNALSGLDTYTIEICARDDSIGVNVNGLDG